MKDMITIVPGLRINRNPTLRQLITRAVVRAALVTLAYVIATDGGNLVGVLMSGMTDGTVTLR